MTTTGSNAQRNPALDFTKGALVLFMVLYHRLEYFVSATGDFYRYIMFVTPSFIFITWVFWYRIFIFLSMLTRRLIFWIGTYPKNLGRVRKHVDLLGSYSLFGYIIQIAILQILYRGLRHVNLGTEALILSFFAAFALTMISVEVVDRLSARSTVVDKLHKAVFA